MSHSGEDFTSVEEKEDGKPPYRFRRKDLEPFAFAGVWEFARLSGDDIEGYTRVEANCPRCRVIRLRPSKGRSELNATHVS